MLRIFIIIGCCLLNFIVAYCQDIKLDSKPVSCYGGTDGEISVSISNTSNIYTLRLLQAVNNKLIDNRQLHSDTVISISGLKAIAYKVQVIFSGIMQNDTISVEEPEMLQANIIEVIKYPSSEQTCDGIIKVNPSGGTPPYTYKWNERDEFPPTAGLDKLCQGIYRCILSDANKCEEVSATVYLVNNLENEKK